MGPTAVDPRGISVPIFDGDPDESFTGPVGISNLSNEEFEVAELFSEDYEDDEEYYEGDGYQQPDPLVRSAAQRADTQDAAQAETVSGHTHG